jgi:hypothetical protein
MSGMKEIMKTKKKKWGRYALPEGFTERRYPKGFKLSHDQQKYVGTQEPELWLSDYLQAVTRGAQRRHQYKAWSYTSPAQHGLG